MKKQFLKVYSLVLFLVACFLVACQEQTLPLKDSLDFKKVEPSHKVVTQTKGQNDDQKETLKVNPTSDRYGNKFIEKDGHRIQYNENVVNGGIDLSPPEENPGLGREAGQILDNSTEKVLLDVPQIVQREWNWCAPSTVSMMLAYRGINVDQAQLAVEMQTNESFGTHNANAIRILNRYLFGYDNPAEGAAGYRLATVKDPSPNSEDMHLFKERLKKDIDDGYPLYFTFEVSSIYDNLGYSGEHNVTLVGYGMNDEGTDIASVYFLDPSYRVQDPDYGALKKVSPENLLKAMMPCLEPNYAW